jgi:hypothetical protein
MTFICLKKKKKKLKKKEIAENNKQTAITYG